MLSQTVENVYILKFSCVYPNLTQVYVSVLNQTNIPFARSYFCLADHVGIVLLTVLMDDKESAGIILALNEPEEIKRIGRHIKNFNQELWGKHCLNVVENGNMAKVS